MVWIGIEEFFYKGNIEFLGEMLSKFSKIFQNSYFCFVYNLTITYPNSVIQISR